MAARFWVGGTGTWDASDTTHWAASSGGAGGQSVPGSADTVTLDASSGGGTITLAYSPTITSITMGTFTGTLDGASYSPTMTTFSNSGSGTRTLTMGSGDWTITGNAATVLDMLSTQNLTLNRGGVFKLTYSGATGTRAVRCGQTAGTEATSIDVSVTAGTDIISTTATVAACRLHNLNFTGFTGSWTIGPSGFNNYLYGSLTLGTGMTTTNGTGGLNVAGTVATQVMTSNSVTIDSNFLPQGTQIVQLADNMRVGVATARSLTLTSGTLDLNGMTLTHFGTFTTAAGTKTFAFNGGTYDNISTTAINVWNNAANTNFTITSTGGGTLKISGSTVSVRTFVGGGNTGYPTLWYTNATGSGELDITGSNTFAVIKCNDTNTQAIKFTAATTTTIGSASGWQVIGAVSNLITIASITAATHTISCASGNVSGNYMSLTNSIASGGATFYAGANSTDGGGNTGWIFTAPPAVGPTNLKTYNTNPTANVKTINTNTMANTKTFDTNT